MAHSTPASSSKSFVSSFYGDSISMLPIHSGILHESSSDDDDENNQLSGAGTTNSSFNILHHISPLAATPSKNKSISSNSTPLKPLYHGKVLKSSFSPLSSTSGNNAHTPVPTLRRNRNQSTETSTIPPSSFGTLHKIDSSLTVPVPVPLPKMSIQSPPKNPKWFYMVVLVLSIVIILMIRTYSIPHHKFNHESALNTLIQLTQHVHPTGSYENEVVVPTLLISKIRSFLTHFKQIPCSTIPQATCYSDSKSQIQILKTRHSGFRNTTRKNTNRISVYSDILNIVVKITPFESTHNNVSSKSKIPVVLLNAHYDSAHNSFGASDNGVSVVVLLEYLSYAIQNPFKDLSLVFLFNGAEEIGLFGAQAFLDHHPWSNDVDYFINLDSAGSASSWPFLFQISPNIPKGIVENLRISSNVLAQNLFDSGVIPSDTDFRVLSTKYSGIDVAFVENGYVYHTLNDAVEHTSHFGMASMYAVVDSFCQSISRLNTTQPLSDQCTSYPVFFDLFRYPIALNSNLWKPLALFMICILLFALVQIFNLNQFIRFILFLFICFNYLILVSFILGFIPNKPWFSHPLLPIFQLLPLVILLYNRIFTMVGLNDHFYVSASVFFFCLGCLAWFNNIGFAYFLFSTSGMYIFMEFPSPLGRFLNALYLVHSIDIGFVLLNFFVPLSERMSSSQFALLFMIFFGLLTIGPFISQAFHPIKDFVSKTWLPICFLFSLILMPMNPQALSRSSQGYLFENGSVYWVDYPWNSDRYGLSSHFDTSPDFAIFKDSLPKHRYGRIEKRFKHCFNNSDNSLPNFDIPLKPLETNFQGTGKAATFHIQWDSYSYNDLLVNLIPDSCNQQLSCIQLERNWKGFIYSAPPALDYTKFRISGYINNSILTLLPLNYSPSETSFLNKTFSFDISSDHDPKPLTDSNNHILEFESFSDFFDEFDPLHHINSPGLHSTLFNKDVQSQLGIYNDNFSQSFKLEFSETLLKLHQGAHSKLYAVMIGQPKDQNISPQPLQLDTFMIKHFNPSEELDDESIDSIKHFETTSSFSKALHNGFTEFAQQSVDPSVDRFLSWKFSLKID